MGSGSGERRSFALEQAVCTCTMVQTAWIPSQVDVAAQGEYRSMPGCQTGLGTRGFGLFSAQPILPQQIYFLVSAPAFLCLELWDGLPAQSGALSAVFPVSSVILLLLSCTGFLICLLFGI